MPVWQIVLLVSALVFAFISIFIWIWNVLNAKKLRAQGFIETKKKAAKPVKLPFKLDKFIHYLGGLDNIIKANGTANKLKVYIKNHDLVDFEQLKKLKNRGILDQSEAVTMIVGSYAIGLSQLLNELVKRYEHNEINVDLEDMKQKDENQ